MKKILQNTLVGLFVAVTISIAGFFTYYGIKSSNNMALLGPVAPRINEAGFVFRDLNKNGKLDPYENTQLSSSVRSDDLLGQMSLAEKAGVMYISQIAVGSDGELVERPNSEDMFSVMSPPNSEMLAGKLMNHFNVVFIHDPEAMATWQNHVQLVAEQTRLGIPVTIATDPRHAFGNNPAAGLPAGDFSLWPEPLGMAATRDPALLEQFGDMARQEYLSVGIRLALHPMADLATEPRWARAAGTFGEDAELSAALVKAYVHGFQGKTLNASSVATMVKHFSGGGPQKDGEDAHFVYGKDQVYPGNNFDYHLIPFEKGAFPAGAAQIMPYYGVPVGQTEEDVGFAYNKAIITGMLRDKYHFDGVICSDWGLVTDAAFFGYTFKAASAWGVEHLDAEGRLLKLLDAGIDQLGGESSPEMLVALVKAGKVKESRLDSSVRRLLLDKFRLGLFDNPYVDVSLVSAVVGKAEFIEAGEAAQRKSLVLLKNGQANKPFLPLQERKKIYIENVSVEVAQQYGDVVADPAQADLAIIRLQAPYYPHEGFFDSFFHSGDLDFKGEEKQRLLALLNTVPTVVDLYLDRAAVIPEITEASAALVANFGVTDEILMELIWGKFNPSGKLPFEMPSTMAAVKKQLEDVPYDSENPLFNFGAGLRYVVDDSVVGVN